VRRLSSCVGLRELYLRGTQVTDQGLLAIHKLPQVWSLVLDDTRVSDEGCAALAEMPQLSLLSLNRTRVAGPGLACLRDNEHFGVYLESTPATDEGAFGKRLGGYSWSASRTTRAKPGIKSGTVSVSSSPKVLDRPPWRYSTTLRLMGSITQTTTALACR
jgi:hypothetical protein